MLLLFSSNTVPRTERSDIDISDGILLTAMDDLFRPHTIAKQTLLNTLGVGELNMRTISYILTYYLLISDLGRLNIHRTDELSS